MTDRKIIFKCRVGSHLYGTNTKDSDEDFAGVFLPSTEDLLGIQNCPTQWSQSEKVSTGTRNQAGDVDCTLYSLQRFLDLAMQGQPGQVEMLFVPDSHIITKTSEWDDIVRNRDKIISNQARKPFIGFCLAQAHRATLKGDNYKKINAMKAWGEKLTDKQKRAPISDHFSGPDSGEALYLGGVEIEVSRNDQGFKIFEVANRSYDINLKTKTFLLSLDVLLAKYGQRTKDAAEVGQDNKFYYHAVRMVGELEELMLTGKMTLPGSNKDFLLDVKTGKVSMDWRDYLTKQIDRIRKEVEPNSILRSEPDRSFVDKFCQSMLLDHLGRKITTV